jgi:hypothetical protein
VIVDPSREPNADATAPRRLATQSSDDTNEEKRTPPSAREWWARIWPSLLAAVTLSAVGGPAAVASYRHARDVITQHGDPVMAPWLALTTDGMLLAALVVIWVRRHRREHVKTGPWAAFWAGMAATMAANLAAAQQTPVGIVVALWPPVCLAITLELVALLASPAKHHAITTDPLPGKWIADAPADTPPMPGHVPVPAEPAPDDEAPETGEAGHDTDTETRYPADNMAAGPAAETTHAQPPATAGTNRYLPVPGPAVPAHHPQDAPHPSGHVPAGTCLSSGMERSHDSGHNGHHGRVQTRRVPDGDILAWLREQACTTGQVPGRRKVIKEWATGSPRAERLRGIVLNEAPTQDQAVTGRPAFEACHG